MYSGKCAGSGREVAIPKGLVLLCSRTIRDGLLDVQIAILNLKIRGGIEQVKFY